MQFDFGRNWSRFSEKSLDTDKVRKAKTDFAGLFEDISLAGKNFLDVGFGQGLSLLIASESGARSVGCDISARCTETVLKNKQRFFPCLDIDPLLVTGSILDEGVLTKLKNLSPSKDGFYDIVHSWGVLHHTGDMYQAITRCSSLVSKGGLFVLAIYNRHWSSPVWSIIKHTYCLLPSWLQRTMVISLYPVIWLAKLIVTRKNPFEQSRGMDFYFNVIDWVGGYPYEYASKEQILSFMAAKGFHLTRMIPAKVPTGCNEFIFIKEA